MKRLLKNILILLFVLGVSGCSTSPAGRTQLKLMPESQMDAMGAESFSKMKQTMPRVTSGPDVRWVTCITHTLLDVMGENKNEWEIQIFKDSSPNAFALPGKKMGVHTGMISLVSNSSELAAVIGHEIAHVKAGHGNERVSQQLIIQSGLSVAQIALGNGKETDNMILAGLGLGAQFGILLPFSRSHEKEADILGLKYMGQAGYDPMGAVSLWQKMAAQGGSPPEFLSTHPSSQSRIQYLSERAQGMPRPEQTPCPR
ncbi:MAG: M48 family metallopeptidase [Bdellovibrionales bacterium]|nr:M48 family metallopeptidase [Bdellovibrionales bacterium]